ncbi:phosphate ABC transporter substrate-binding protein PstS [Stomatohabitans albus]|uniref:phosphate ABC transporter substrate-binding protein PstS n=1 Tax=Stomatohabitans albus TaxID=3110766 RepID=UPI00300D331A
MLTKHPLKGMSLVALLVLSMSACTSGGTPKPTPTSTSTLSGAIAGAGASSQSAAMQAWIATFAGAHPSATVNYDPVGSGGGREQFIEGAVAFAATDAPLSTDEVKRLPDHCRDFIQLPGYISPIAIAFNIEGVSELSLSPDSVAKLFAGEITRWNDPQLLAENPGVPLPDLYVNPVHRSDGSGTTETFTEYLHDTAPDIWTTPPDKNWPDILPGEAAQQTSGVVQTIAAGNGSIGYADASQIGALPSVKIKVGDEFVPYSAQGAATLVEQSPRIAQPASPFDYSLHLDRTVKGGYPIVLVAYQLACPTYSDGNDAKLVRTFLSHVFSEDGQAIAAVASGSAPLSARMREQALKGIETIGPTE